jgi:hypothetical protein
MTLSRLLLLAVAAAVLLAVPASAQPTARAAVQ